MNIYKKAIIGISGFSAVVALLLIIIELNTEGTCPPFPLFGFPTCYLVFLLYALVFGSQFDTDKLRAQWVFWIASLVGLLTAFWFSTDQLIGLSECPKLNDLPLCYVALIGWGVLMWFKSKESSKSR